MHAIAHGDVRTHVRESALKVDSGRKLPCRTRVSNLPQRRTAPTLYQLSYLSTPRWLALTLNDKCEKLGMIQLLVAMEPALNDLPDDRPPLFRDHFFRTQRINPLLKARFYWSLTMVLNHFCWIWGDDLREG